MAALPSHWKVLITGFLLVLGAGYLSGALNAKLSVGVTPAAIGEHYRDQTLSHEEAAQMEKAGFVEEEFSFDDPEPMADMAAMGEMPGMDHHAMAAGGDMATASQSITPQQLAQLSHVHLLGFAMILLSVGGLICLTGWGEGLKSFGVALLSFCLLADIGGLILVRFVSDGFALLNMLAGTGIGVVLLATTLRCMWEMWLTPATA